MTKTLIAVSFLFLLGCKKTDPTYPFLQEQLDEGLTEEQDNAISALPARDFEPADILMDDGETLQDFLTRVNPGARRWGNRLPGSDGR